MQIRCLNLCRRGLNVSWSGMMNDRDMKIAEAILWELCINYGFMDKSQIDTVDIESIIARVEVDDEPYCWMVTGSSVPFYGEFAQMDAEREAKHCGGTAKAFPLYTAPQATEVVGQVNAQLLEAAEMEAARYRWLRDKACSNSDIGLARYLYTCEEYPEYEAVDWLSVAEFEVAIDSAMGANHD